MDKSSLYFKANEHHIVLFVVHVVRDARKVLVYVAFKNRTIGTILSKKL